MIDMITRERILIHAEGTAAPYLIVPQEQLEALTVALRSHQVSYWVDEDAISLDGEPPVTFVNLGRGANVDSAQRVLDGI